MESSKSGNAKGKRQIEDESIMGTNNSSIVSKRSVERLYFPTEPQYLRCFVKKPHRRSPLINRGYWLRMKLIDTIVRRFLEQPTSRSKVVINLGCGYDPLFWQSLTRYPALCSGVRFVDVDYEDLMTKKRAVVQSNETLQSVLTNVKINAEHHNGVLLRSDQYVQVGCDLRELFKFQQILEHLFDFQRIHVLLVAEVSITYMDVDASDRLIAWAAERLNATFCLLEQLLPGKESHPFGQTMLAHFRKLKTTLKAVHKYPSLAAQQARFQKLGYGQVSAHNLWELWSSSDLLTPSERTNLDAIEPFDEWEDFALFGCHYVLVVASNTSIVNGEIKASLFNVEPRTKTSFGISPHRCNMFFSPYSQSIGCRRFAAPMIVRGTSSYHDMVGNFAGMGLKSRTNACDVYSAAYIGKQPFYPRCPQPWPSSRMCHTITDLGDVGALLVGGRTSPDNALADCWLYQKWLGAWEKVDSLPKPRYRHFAVSLGNGYVLIGGGKLDSQVIANDFLVWSRRSSWAQCSVGESDSPCATFGSTSFLIPSSIPPGGLIAISGIIIGGLSCEGTIEPNIWKWQLSDVASSDPRIDFVEQSHGTDLRIARFGACSLVHKGKICMIGGIISNEILHESEEISGLDPVSLAVLSTSIQYSDSTVPRPVLIGVSAVSTGDEILLMGGSAVCFSFGAHWNAGCYTIQNLNFSDRETKLYYNASKHWQFIHCLKPRDSHPLGEVAPESNRVALLTDLPRLRIAKTSDFDQVVAAGRPVIIGGLDLGPCTSLWTASYLKEQIGSEHQVIIHESSSEHMDFQKRNFSYVTKRFGDFIDEVESGHRHYLRSLSSENRSELPADITKDFSSISVGFKLPAQLSCVSQNAHSSPLRISGPVSMWLHYDVMANVLCQIRGSKRLLLYPPSDVKHLDFDPGASSSSVNVFEKLHDPTLRHTHPHEAKLQPGEVLYLPPLWLHSARPISDGMNVAVNIFFRNLQRGYAAGRDVYGNRDLQAYEKGRQDIAKIVRSFDGLPHEAQVFYLQRLLQEFGSGTSES